MEDGYILLKNVAKTFHRSRSASVEVLKDFNLSIGKGEVVSLHGPIGCGKSTILGIIARTLDQDAGIVQIAGKTPQIGEVGFLFQDYGASLFPWMTCAENIAFGLRLRGVDKRTRLSKARTIAASINLGVDLNKYPYELSGGQQQLVALARALCAGPSAIMMDEPFSSLDATIREQVRAVVIKILCAQRVTVVLVSHHLEDCVVVSDRIIFLTPLPAREYRSETVELSGEKANRKVYSDDFAAVISRLRNVALEARKL